MEKITNLLKPNQKTAEVRLRNLNIVLAALLLLQLVGLLILSSPANYQLTSSYKVIDTLQSSIAKHPVTAGATNTLLTINLTYLVAGFLLVAAIAHLLMATVYRRAYATYIKNKTGNKILWTQYGISGGLMLVVLAIISGVTDFPTLLMLFGLVFVSCLFVSSSILGAKNLSKTSVNWARWLAVIVSGLLPWAVVAFYLAGSNISGNGGAIDSGTYWIYGTALAFFVLVAVMAFMQNSGRGRFKDKFYSEQWLLILGFVVQSVVAWQIFAWLLKP